MTRKVRKEPDRSKFLEPLPVDSFIRHQILKLFINAGLDDFQSQILLSIVLHGGQIKPITLAKDIHCNPARLELPDGFPSLLGLNLIVMSHTRPKTVILAIGIDELIERLSTRTLVTNNHLSPKEARELIFKLDQFRLSLSKSSDKPDDFTNSLDYFTKLQELAGKIPSLHSLLNFSLLSLWMPQTDTFVLTKLIGCGGIISKRQFFLDQIKNNDLNSLTNSTSVLESDLRKIGYNDKQAQRIANRIDSYLKQAEVHFKISNEQQFNITLNALQNYCQSTSMGKKEGTRKFKNLTLIKTLSQVAEIRYQTIVDFKKAMELELQTLKLAYSNVKLINGDIFLSSIADPSSTRKRLETDLKYAKDIYLVLNHSFFIEDLFLKIFGSENLNSKLNLIIAEEQKELVLGMLSSYKSGLEGKRGILVDDTITFTPSDNIPQDVLIGNILILFYQAGSSMIIIHEEITKRNPTEINTIPHDVDLAFNSFNNLKKDNPENTKSIISFINKGGT
jgi:hypothetical protein